MLPGKYSRAAPAITQRGSQHGLLCGLSAREFSGDTPVMHDQHPVCKTQYFLKIAGNYDDGETLIACKSDDQPVNFSACAHINSPGRFVNNQDSRFCRQPFGNHDLLLVATRKVSHSLAHIRSFDTETFDVAFGQHFSALKSRNGPRVSCWS